jgi:transposase
MVDIITLVANKLGIDNATYNIQLKKHKSTKLSIIIDDFGVPIHFELTNSNIHDASVFCNQLDTIVNKYPNLCTNDNIFIGDSAYDSNNIREKLKTYMPKAYMIERL